MFLSRITVYAFRIGVFGLELDTNFVGLYKLIRKFLLSF